MSDKGLLSSFLQVPGKLGGLLGEISDAAMGQGNHPYPADISDKMKNVALQLGTGGAAIKAVGPIEESIIKAFNGGVAEHNALAARRGFDGEPFEPVTSLDEIDAHKSAIAREAALNAAAQSHGWEVNTGTGSQTTASSYFDLRKPSGLKDEDGFPVDMSLKARVSDHGNSHGGNDINFSPGADGMQDVLDKLSSAHLDDPSDPANAAVIFGQQK